MKLTCVEKYKGRTMQLSFEGGETAYLNADIVQRYSLRAGVDIPEAAWAEIVHADTYRRARERAMYLLDYRDYSYVELCKKLMNNYEEDICFEVADSLAEHGFINDARYAETIARRQFEVKLFGAYRVRLYMREKGIPAAIIEQALEPYAAELVKRKYMKYYDPDDRAMMQKLKNALARQGYGYGEIKDALDILRDGCGFDE
jgi:regulatory protein